MKIDETFQDSLKDQDTLERTLVTLRLVPVFEQFTADELSAVLQLTRKVHYEPKEILFRQGGDDRTLHMILSGSVLLYTEDEDGQETIVGQRGLDNCFGEIAFLTGEVRHTSAKAGPEGSEQLVLEAQDFQELTRISPQLTFKMLGTIIENIDERLHDLPSSFRHHVVWGTKRPGLREPPKPLDKSYLGGGLAVGLLIGLMAGSALGGFFVEQYKNALGLIPWTKKAFSWTTGVTLAVTGLLIGWKMALAKMKRTLGGVGPRCCLNCKFVILEGIEERFGCAYTILELKGKTVKPGPDYDSPTDCPSFQYRDIARLG